MNFGRNSLQIGNFHIYYYGMIIAIAILVAFAIGLLMFRVVGYKDEIAYMILILCVPLGIIGARLYYVIFSDWSMYNSFFDVINMRGGGMAIYGGIIGGALGLFIVARIKKCGFFTLADLCVVGLILAQSIGRFGNFVNQEAYGFAVGVHVPPFTVNIDGQAHLATWFFESMLNLIGFVVLFIWYTMKLKREKYVWGTGSAMYLIWYGVTRAIIEPLRNDSLTMFGSSTFLLNRVSFMLSLAIIIAGVVLYICAKKGLVSQENKECLKK